MPRRHQCKNTEMGRGPEEQAMDIRPIHTEDDYRAVLHIVSGLVNREPKLRPQERDQLEILGNLIVAYEARHYPVDPIEFLKTRIKQQRKEPQHSNEPVDHPDDTNRGTQELSPHEREQELLEIAAIFSGIKFDPIQTLDDTDRSIEGTISCFGDIAGARLKFALRTKNRFLVELRTRTVDQQRWITHHFTDRLKAPLRREDYVFLPIAWTRANLAANIDVACKRGEILFMIANAATREYLSPNVAALLD